MYCSLQPAPWVRVIPGTRPALPVNHTALSANIISLFDIFITIHRDQVEMRRLIPPCGWLMAGKELMGSS